MPTVLACDDISQVGLDLLAREGFEVRRRSRISADELLEALPGVDVLLVRSRTRVSEAVLDAGADLKLIGRAGFALDTIDVPAATERGVAVMHSPQGTAVAAAEFTVGLLFCLARSIPQGHQGMRSGRWLKSKLRGLQLQGKFLGVIGAGAVGRQVVGRASALGMTVLVHDPGVDPQEVASWGGQAAGWGDLLACSDFITVHVPGTGQTRGLVADAAFDRMKDGVRIVVTSRGGVVDEAALVRALRTGRVGAAAVDVYNDEPPWGSELLGFDEVIATPHLVASTFEAQEEVAVHLAEQVRDWFAGGGDAGVVNGIARQR